MPHQSALNCPKTAQWTAWLQQMPNSPPLSPHHPHVAPPDAPHPDVSRSDWGMGVIQKRLVQQFGAQCFVSLIIVHTHKKKKLKHHITDKKNKSTKPNTEKQKPWFNETDRMKEAGESSQSDNRRRGRGGGGACLRCGGGACRRGRGKQGHFKREADRLALRAGLWWECDRSESPGTGAALRPLRTLYRSHKKEDRVKTSSQNTHPSLMGRSHIQTLYHSYYRFNASGGLFI